MTGACEVFFFDVGQGSSSLVFYMDESEKDEAKRRKAVLIDCGRNASSYLGFVRQHASHLEAVILSHCHDDHYGGALEVVQNYTGTDGLSLGKVVYLWDSPSQPQCQKFQVLHDLVQSKGLLHRMDAQKSPKGGYAPFHLECIYPKPDENGKFPNDGGPNTVCGVLALETSHEHRVVFTGDVPYGRLKPPHCTYFSPETRKGLTAITIPHHGSAKNTTAKEISDFFERQINAEVALASVGTHNTYTHPATSVIHAAKNHAGHVACSQITKHCFKQACLPASETTNGIQRRGSNGGYACLGHMKVILGWKEKALWGCEDERDRQNLADLGIDIHFDTLSNHFKAAQAFQKDNDNIAQLMCLRAPSVTSN